MCFTRTTREISPDFKAVSWNCFKYQQHIAIGALIVLNLTRGYVCWFYRERKGWGSGGETSMSETSIGCLPYATPSTLRTRDGIELQGNTPINEATKSGLVLWFYLEMRVLPKSNKFFWTLPTYKFLKK